MEEVMKAIDWLEACEEAASKRPHCPPNRGKRREKSSLGVQATF